MGELADGNKSVMSSLRSGIVTSVNLSGVEETVQFGGLSFPISQIKQISRAPTTTTSQPPTVPTTTNTDEQHDEQYRE